MKILRLLLLALPAACGDAPAGPAPESGLERAVYASFHPTAYLAERIASGRVPVVCPLPPGEDPVHWQPDRATLARFQRAALVALNGAGLERWADGASLPRSRVVETARAFEERWIERAAAEAHAHGALGEHVHAGVDPHTWLDPELAREQARALLDAMCRAFPADAEAFRAGHAALDRDLAALAERFRALAPALRAANVLAAHPAYDYLARGLGFEVASFDLDPEAPPGEAERAALAAALRPGVPNLLLWESEPSPAAAAGLPAGLRSVVVSPAESPGPGEPDLLGTMRANAERLERALRDRR